MSRYRVVKEVHGVKVAVPTKGCVHMQPVAAHEFINDEGETVKVPAHWKHGQMVGDTGVVLNRHFYNITDTDMEPRGTKTRTKKTKEGRKVVTTQVKQTINATVRVMEKVTDGGSKYIILDIFKTEGKPEWEMVITPKRENEEDTYLVLNYCLHFRRLPTKEAEANTKATDKVAEVQAN